MLKECGACDEGNFCSMFGRNFLIGVNLLSAVSGLLLCAGGAYLWIEYENQFAELLSTGPILGVMIAGFVLFVITMVGVYGAVTGKKTVLIAYMVVIILFISIEVAASVIFLQYLDFIENSQSQNSTLLEDSTEIEINNFIYRAYHTCCVSNVEFCSGLQADVNFCAPVQFCNDPLFQPPSDACIQDEREPAQQNKEVEFGVCTALQNIKYNDEFLVGLVEAGNTISCGGGQPSGFEAAVTDFLKDNINFFGYGALGVGILEFLIIVFSLILVLTRQNIIPKAEVVGDIEDGTESTVSFATPVRSSVDRRSVDRRSVNRVSYRA